MKLRSSYRVPLGFSAGFIFLIRADPNLLSFFTGTAFMLCGEVIRFVSAGTIVKSREVTRNGIYSYSRNPLYIGSFLIGAGACVIGRDPLFTVFFFIAYPCLYLSIIKHEERSLLDRFGEDYKRYLCEVPRFWSGRFDIGAALRETSPSLAVKNLELHTIIGIGLVLAIMVVKMVY